MEAKAKLGLPETDSALEVRWINRQGKGGQRDFDEGLRETDVIVALAGNPIQMDTRRFNMHIKLNYELGEDSPLSVLRNGQRKKIKIRLVE